MRISSLCHLYKDLSWHSTGSVRVDIFYLSEEYALVADPVDHDDEPIVGQPFTPAIPLMPMDPLRV